MKLEVEENTDAQRGDFFYGRRPGCREKLVANLEHADERSDLFGELERGV